MSIGRMPKYGARRDDNEKPIVKQARQAGAKVIYISAPGKPDLLVYWPPTGRWFVGDIKQKKGKATDLQSEWDILVAPDAIPFWRTIEDLLITIGAMDDPDPTHITRPGIGD